MKGFVVSTLVDVCAFRGPEKGNSTFQMYVIVDAKRQ